MDQQQERIVADLAGQLEGEVLCDALGLQLYASDASVYQVAPTAVVRPRNLADVVATMRYAHEHEIPVRPRGAGTGLAGESLGDGIVIDFSHSMRRVIAMDQDTVRVQPGVVLAELNRHLAPTGRMFGPDPSTRSVTTIGSVLALDGAGSHWPIYGSARQHVRSMQIVLADGEVLEVSKHSTRADDGPPRRRELVRRLGQLLERDVDYESHWPQSPVNRCGYNIRNAVADGQVNLGQLIVGSEGTLALITEATLTSVPMAPERGVAMLFFERLDQAARGAVEAGKLQPASCDLMDRRLLSIARETDRRFDQLIPVNAEALLVVEFHGDDYDSIQRQLQSLTQRVQRKRKLAFHVVATSERDERDLYWRLVRRVVPRLYRLKGNERPLPFVEDIAVPPESLPNFLVDLQNLLKTQQITATVFAHALQGQLHVRPFLNLDDQGDVRRMQDLAAALYEKVLEFRGTISGEHGAGLSRTWFVRRQYGPLYDTMSEVKRIFDPGNLLNPGKVIAEAPAPLTKHLRPVARDKDSDPLPTLLNWAEGELEHTTRSCNGCGRCRTQSSDERMCPIFRFSPSEEASPRAKANLMRAVITGTVPPSELSSETMKDYADLCVNCHQCRVECPATVDIPKLMLEAKAQYVAANGLRLPQWCIARLERLSSFGSRLSRLANWALRNRQMRWLLERLLGIAQGRKLPRFAGRTFIRHAHRLRLTKASRQAGAKVLYFVDVYANWHDPQLGIALTEVMRHNGVSVYVPPEPLVSHMPGITLGDTERLKRSAAKNVALLAEAVRQGYTIVTTEPAASACIKHEYLAMLEDEDARLVADNTMDACEYLWSLHQVGNLELDFRPLSVTVGYHLPCHLRSRGVVAGRELLRLIPGMNVVDLDRGCSGMAGAFGLLRENYRNSLRAGWGLISAVRDPKLAVGATECSACKLQMEQGTSKPTIHPLKILALAYGRLGVAEELLALRGEELLAT
ncbi:MAG: FAD-binding protein [Planctomycetales bacterium]|nr:FAD-binding protein [Planctomycetales bacterium]